MFGTQSRNIEQPQSKAMLIPNMLDWEKGNGNDKFSRMLSSPKQGWYPSNIHSQAHLQFKTHMNNVAVISNPIKVKTGYFVEHGGFSQLK